MALTKTAGEIRAFLGSCSDEAVLAFEVDIVGVTITEPSAPEGGDATHNPGEDPVVLDS